MEPSHSLHSLSEQQPTINITIHNHFYNDSDYMSTDDEYSDDYFTDSYYSDSSDDEDKPPHKRAHSDDNLKLKFV